MEMPQAGNKYYDKPAYGNRAPPASALPIPKWCKRPSARLTCNTVINNDKGGQQSAGRLSSNQCDSSSTRSPQRKDSAIVMEISDSGAPDTPVECETQQNSGDEVRGNSAGSTNTSAPSTPVSWQSYLRRGVITGMSTGDLNSNTAREPKVAQAQDDETVQEILKMEIEWEKNQIALYQTTIKLKINLLKQKLDSEMALLQQYQSEQHQSKQYQLEQYQQEYLRRWDLIVRQGYWFDCII